MLLARRLPRRRRTLALRLLTRLKRG